MRTRTKSDIAKRTYRVDFRSPSGTSAETRTLDTLRIVASMEDIGGPSTGVKPCSQWTFNCPKCPISTGWSVSKSDPTVSARLYDSDFLAGGGPSPPTFENPDYDTMMQELVNDAVGIMPSKLNTIVNVIEFKQLKQMVPELLKLARKLSARGAGKFALKDLANGHLLYSFGVKPFISDFTAFLNIRQSVQARLDQLAQRDSTLVRLAKRGQYQKSVSNTYSRGNPVSGHAGKLTFAWDATVKGCVSCDCLASYDLDSSTSQCKMWAQALGLTTPLSSTWELIPFSFVVDWFLPIGKRFVALENKLLRAENTKRCDLSNFCWSKKVEADVTGQGSVESQAYPSWNGLRLSASSGKYKAYSRMVTMPPGGFSPPSGWSLNRSALTISLIVQRVKG